MISPREIAEFLTLNRSKANINKLIASIEKEGLDFNAFFSEVQHQKQPIRWYMTWLLTHYVEANKEMGSSIQTLIWNQLKATTNQSMLRDLWRCMSHIDVNEEISGEVYDQATRVFTSQKHAIAVRAHALECACYIAKPYPELREEMKLFLKPLKEDESPGMRSKAKNWLRAFS